MPSPIQANARPASPNPRLSRKSGNTQENRIKPPSPPVFMKISCIPATSPCFQPPFVPFVPFVVCLSFLPVFTALGRFSPGFSPFFAFFAHFVVSSPFSPFPAPLRAIFSPKKSFWRQYLPFSAPDPPPDESEPPEPRFALPLAPFSAKILPPAKAHAYGLWPGELRESGIIIYRTDPISS